MDLCNCDSLPLLFVELDHHHGGRSLMRAGNHPVGNPKRKV
jgi:hypothetical protein